MRIDRLGLSPCGPFVQHEFVFGSGLQLIFGANEAGKSSTLKALYALLYGFKDDELRFGAAEPRLHGTLRDALGNQVSFIRRRGRKDTLLDEQRRPLAADTLEPFLRGVSAKMFREFFGIDWKTFQEGSLQLLEDRGDLAESLFGASLGNGELKRLLKELDEKARDKFTPNTRTKGIAKLLSDCKQLEGELKNQTTRPEQFARAQAELSRVQREAEKLRSAQERSRGRLVELSRQCEALALWQELQELQSQRLALGELPRLARDFASRRSAAQTAWEKARAELQELACQRQQLQAELDSLKVQENWLQQASHIAELNERRAGLQPIREQLPQREHEVVRLGQESDELRAQLGLAAEAACASALQREQLQQLADKLLAEKQICESLERSLHERRRHLQLAEQQRQEVAAAPDPLPLQLLAEESSRALTLLEPLRQAQSAAELARAERDAAFGRLPLWRGSLEELLAFALPLPAQRDACASELLRCQQRQQELQRELHKLQTRSAELQRQYAEASGDLPSPEELQQARARRDQLWQQLQSQELDQTARSEFERAVRFCDEVTDRLLEGAERLARRQALGQQLHSLGDECRTCEQQLAQAEQQRQAAELRWTELWQPLQPLAPQAMSDWVLACEALLQKHSTWLQRHREAAELQARLDAMRQQLVQTLEGVPDSSIEELHRHIRTRLQALEASRNRLRQLEGEITTLGRDLQREQAQLQRSREIVEQLQAQFETHWLASGLPGQTRLEIVPTLLRLLSRLETVEHEQRRRASSLLSDKQQCERFEQACAEIAERLGLPRPQRDYEAFARGLAQTLGQEQEKARRRQELQRQLAQLEITSQRQSSLAERAQAELQELLAQAGVPEPQLLPELEERVGRALELDVRLAEKRAALERLWPSQRLGELEQWSLVALQSERAAEQQRLAETLERLREVDQRQGAAQLTLEQLQERQGCIDKAQELENLHNRILEESEQYLRLQLARGVLRKEVERYSQSRQQPLLRGTSDYFRRLTGNRYQEVVADYEGERQVLFGVRGPERVAIEGMSQGTRDQLYLALRLATLDHWMERRGPFPLVLDDLCVQFDDTRAAATLEVLSELGQRTQVLFFTHLQRDVQLARALPGQLHELPQPCLELAV